MPNSAEAATISSFPGIPPQRLPIYLQVFTNMYIICIRFGKDLIGLSCFLSDLPLLVCSHSSCHAGLSRWQELGEQMKCRHTSGCLQPGGLCICSSPCLECLSTRDPLGSLFRSSSNITQAFPDPSTYHLSSRTHVCGPSLLLFLKYLTTNMPCILLNSLLIIAPTHTRR